MDKVRFACPRCRTIMQTSADKVGYDVACPHCAHRFKIVESESAHSVARTPTADYDSSDAATAPPRQSPVGPANAGFSSTPSAHASYQPVSQPADKIGVYPGGTYRCPYCQTTDPPIWKSEVSTVGWIVFAVLLVSTCFLCFIGLFIRDRYRICSRCRVRLD